MTRNNITRKKRNNKVQKKRSRVYTDKKKRNNRYRPLSWYVK